MLLDGFVFEGPFHNLDEIRDEPGVYVVLGLRPGEEPVVLDVGESGWAHSEGGQGVRQRLKKHDRKRCWEENVPYGAAIVFAVLYERNGFRRLDIEERLRKFFEPPCGTNAPSIG